ncbi:helix-turn-helix transcriptional regulator [Neobacillus cucumis]|uniref:helix-turn-helix domain-containing protein n=1 Tax=Neobacillus cucumis TaxID=1740721 RepID=UPI0020410ECE|nr:helix-turn-helix transcriptional regulator [Neobacillus cucumis]MCM3729118.1 helix-turn-helix transcriptional regulator [Neobacillus cucumis]
MGKRVVVKLPELIVKHNMSMRELSRLADVRPQALNELANQKRRNINFGHLERIADVFDTNDMNEIITLVDTDDDDE